MQCAFCGRPIKAKSAWKGTGDKFYCGEFCADSETTETASMVLAPVPVPCVASIAHPHCSTII